MEGVDLADLLAYARLNNPKLAASKASWKAFIQARKLGTAYPDPKLVTTIFPKPIETRLGPQDFNITLNQPIPFPGLLNTKGRVLTSDVVLARLNHNLAIKEVITGISKSWYELAYLERALDLAERDLALKGEMEEIARLAYGRDQSLFAELARLGIQVAKIQTRINELEERADLERIKLNGLLNRVVNAPLGPISSTGEPLALPGFDLEMVQGLAVAHGEEVRMAEERIKKAQSRLELARLENKPRFSLGVFYAGIGEPDLPNKPKDSGEDALGVQFGVSFPLWSGKRGSRLAKAKAEKLRAQALKTEKINQIQTRVSRIWFAMERAKRNHELQDRESLPRARQALETAQALFRQGRGQLDDVLRFQAAVHDFELARARARTDFFKGRAELEKLAGVLLTPGGGIHLKDREIP